LRASDPSPLDIGQSATLYFFLPICAAGILLGAQYCWYVAGAIAVALSAISLYTQQSFWVGFHSCETICMGTAMIWLGMRGLYRALRETDNSLELAALNQRLEASAQEIAARA
jgi:hypothetical protein